MVDWFQTSYWLYQHTPAHVLDRQVFEATSGRHARDRMIRLMGDYVQTEGRRQHRRIVGHQLRLGVNGFRDAKGGIWASASG